MASALRPSSVFARFLARGAPQAPRPAHAPSPTAAAAQRLLSASPGGGRRLKDVSVPARTAEFLDRRGLGIPKRRRGRKGYAKHRPGSYVKPNTVTDVEKAILKRTGAPASPAAEKLFKRSGPSWNSRKLWAAAEEAEVPRQPSGVSEVLIIGRSNVGKSTLINGLLDIKGHPLRRARVSDRPGETRGLEAYGAGAHLCVIDAPGYGFAFADGDDILKWHHLMLRFLQSKRQSLRRIFLLLDGRHGLKKADRDFLAALGHAVPTWEEYERMAPGTALPRAAVPRVQAVLTKCDLVDREQLARRMVLTREELDEALRPVQRGRRTLPVLATSARRDAGLLDIHKVLLGFGHHRRT